MSEKQVRSLDNQFDNETAIKEVQHLLKNGVTDLTPDIVNNLRTKYSDDNVLDAIMESFADRKTKISKVATIFVDAFQRKYKNEFYSMSMSKFMKRALKYKSKYNLSNEELDEAKRLFEIRVFNSGQELNVVYPNTNLSRILGYPVTESTDKIKPSNSDDFSYLQEILKLYQLYKSLHSYIVIQTMTYTDLQPEALTGVFKSDRHNVNVHVHPVLAALFLPKIDQLEERMLYANIAGIINTKYNGHRIVTRPDFQLFYSMVIDPADAVCDNGSPMKDLKSRVEVQIQLWNNIYNLRSGKYFDATSVEFMAYIDKCKISTLDNPDLIYLSDEGVILRRLFTIFAYKPILVQTIPIMGVITANPLSIPVNIQAVTAIPYISYRLPQIPVVGKSYNLEEALRQVNYYMENGTFVPKMTQLLNCNGPIIFYVPRRFTALPLNIASPQVGFFGINNYDISTRHYQRINNIQLDYSPTFETTTYGNTTVQVYYLRSAVAYDLYNDTNIVLGHITVLYKYNRGTDNLISDATPIEHILYIPRRANLEESNGNPFQNANDMTIRELLVSRGTLFVYAIN